MEKRTVVVAGVYRYFQGGEYMVLAVASHTEREEVLVVYTCMTGDCETWAMPYDEFLAKVDTEKYPEALQDYQFELVEEWNEQQDG